MPMLTETDEEESHTSSLTSKRTLSLAGGFKWTASERGGAAMEEADGQDSSNSSEEELEDEKVRI